MILRASSFLELMILRSLKLSDELSFSCERQSFESSRSISKGKTTRDVSMHSIVGSSSTISSSGLLVAIRMLNMKVQPWPTPAE